MLEVQGIAQLPILSFIEQPPPHGQTNAPVHMRKSQSSGRQHIVIGVGFGLHTPFVTWPGAQALGLTHSSVG